MIDLITGLPGNCKTLYTIAWVRDWAKRDARPVFYSGIPLSDEGKAELGWTEIDPEKWMECPPKSIIVIDECQRVFRNRSINSQPPKFVTDLETHRHLGVDLVFITQHPMLIDPAIRRLTGRHRHMVRIWGLEASTVHEWPAVRDNCDKPASRKDSEKAKWKFDKSVYRLYKSAEVHTGKRMIPMRAKLLLLVPVLLAAAVWYVYGFVKGKTTAPEKPVPAAAAPAGSIVPAGVGAVPGGPREGFDPLADAKKYVYERTPRVVGLQHTAPVYDDLTKPSRVPVPAACVEMAERCRCYTQQGTVLDTPGDMCRQIVANGYFVDFEPEGRGGAEAQPGLHRGDAVPVHQSAAAPGAGVLSVADAPVRRLGEVAQNRLGEKGGKS